MSKEVLAEQIATRLRRDILRGHLPPGVSIKERDIANEMGVSRTPIREAVRILAQDSLVELRPSRSPIVTISNHIEVGEQTVVLIELEKLSARLACRHATDRQLEEMGHLVREIADNYDTGDPVEVFELDMAFHTAIAEASGNRSLAETHRAFLMRLWRARYLAAEARREGTRIVDEHFTIHSALSNRDEAAAEAAVTRHLWRLAEDVRELVEKDAEAQTATGMPQV